jgi:general secretion pathway protein E
MGQRLIRILCPDCKQSYVVDEKQIDTNPRLVALNIPKGAELFAPQGCVRCGHSGYRGRRAIFELLEITEQVRHLILTGADDSAIEKQACKDGMTTMVQDGRERCLEGQTTVDEVFRVAALR